MSTMIREAQASAQVISLADRRRAIQKPVQAAQAVGASWELDAIEAHLLRDTGTLGAEALKRFAAHEAADRPAIAIPANVTFFMDPFRGAYSGGEWIIVDSPMTEEGGVSRIVSVLQGGPSGDEIEAGLFWNSAPNWIASGPSPETAYLKLRSAQLAF